MSENTELVITDHALIRYLERGFGLSLEDVREEMRTVSAVRMAEQNVNGAVILPRGCKAVIRHGKMTTVLT